MLEIVNNYYTVPGQSVDIWEIVSSLATLAAVLTALGMHLHSERKRDKEKSINKLEQEIDFLSGCHTELLAIQEKADEFFDYIGVMPESYSYEFDGVFETPMYMHINRDYFSYYNSNISNIEKISNNYIKNKLVKLHLSYKILLDDLDLQRSQIEKIDYEIKCSRTSTKIIEEVEALNYQNNQAKNDMVVTKEIYYELIDLLDKEIKEKSLKLKELM